jgi:hypothetical protein
MADQMFPIRIPRSLRSGKGIHKPGPKYLAILFGHPAAHIEIDDAFEVSFMLTHGDDRIIKKSFTFRTDFGMEHANTLSDQMPGHKSSR